MMQGSYHSLNEKAMDVGRKDASRHMQKWEYGRCVESLLRSGQEEFRETLEGSIAKAIVTRSTARRIIGEQEKKGIAKRVASMYAAFVGASEVMGALEEQHGFGDINETELTQYKRRHISEQFERINLTTQLKLGDPGQRDPHADIDKILAAYIDFIKQEEPRGNQVPLHTYLYFSKLRDDVVATIDTQTRETVKRNITLLEQSKLRVGNNVYTGFSVASLVQEKKRAADERRTQQRTEREASKLEHDVVVIGNEYATQELTGLVRTVAAYDPDAQANALVDQEEPRPLSILLYGRPGTGKSTLMKYAARILARVAKAKGISYNEVVLDNSFQDEYHGRDVKNLREKIEEIEDPSSLGLFILDDIDGMVQSRDARDHSHLEGKPLHAIMQWLDGMETTYVGNYLIIAATNHPGKVDGALRNRFTQEIEIRGPETVDQYAALMRSKLNGTKRYIPLSEGELASIGQTMLDRGYSGRDIHNITTTMGKSVNNAHAITEEFCRLPYAEQIKKLPSVRRTLGFADVREIVDAYKPARP